VILHFSSFPSPYGWILHKASLYWGLLPSLPSSTSCTRLPFFTDYLLSSPFRASAPREMHPITFRVTYWSNRVQCRSSSQRMKVVPIQEWIAQ
jgi:hypothetical protein